VLAAALVMTALIAADGYMAATGCGSIDPTDPANYTSARLVNDTASPVTVDSCDGAYCVPDELPAALNPGGSLGIQGACGTTGSDMTSWRVTRDGVVAGYVVIHSPKSRHGVVYEVSRLSPDRKTPSQPDALGAPTA
jgi:hypothetical protein